MVKKETQNPTYDELLKKHEIFVEEINRVRGLKGLDLDFGLRHYYDFVFPMYAKTFHLALCTDWGREILVLEKMQKLVKHEVNRDTKNPELVLEWISDYVKCIDEHQKFLLSDIDRHEKKATEYLRSMEGK